MKILYIIGNGLDIAHHMKTSYQDFFTYYLALPSTDRDILAMKNDIDNDIGFVSSARDMEQVVVLPQQSN